MRRFTIVLLSAAGICLPLAANAAPMQNAPVAPNTSSVISVSGARDILNGLSEQVALLNGEVLALQQQMQNLPQQPVVTTQAPAPLYPESVGG